MNRAIMVAVPCTETMPTASAIAFRNLILPPRSEVRWLPGSGTIASKRNILTQEFQAARQFGTLLWLDSDMVFPSHLAQQLQRHGLPVVAGLCFWRRAPFHPAAMAGEHDLFTDFDNQLHEVWAVGTGCLMVQREVVEALKEPFFEDGHFGDPGLGEDIYHCRRITDAGFKIHLDTSIRISHVGQVEVDLEFLEMWLTFQQSKGRLRPEGCCLKVEAGSLPRCRSGGFSESG